MYGKCQKSYLLLTFFLTTVFLNVGFAIPIFSIGSLIDLKRGAVSASCVSCPPHNPEKVSVKSRNATAWVIFKILLFLSVANLKLWWWWWTNHHYFMLISSKVPKFMTVIQLITETTKPVQSIYLSTVKRILKTKHCKWIEVRKYIMRNTVPQQICACWNYKLLLRREMLWMIICVGVRDNKCWMIQC